MPEGDTNFRAARALRRALAGKGVTRFESVFPAVTRVAGDHPVVGRAIASVTARGKDLLMTSSGELILHPRMRMNGSWHLYPRRRAPDAFVTVSSTLQGVRPFQQ